ncbi:hypothetical protein CFIO01_11839 [Colletotrichum fioriniae PJ7]|uniref:Uncharacterized protein n=1 Tax=Colletotrichum fioriniae PJ7 TaxID=1445577 RepID=A0A010QG87_9PEZI|nr:hypothetical protein CFIO01_11839 [Colletotrichum fioriniae PJ7]
MATSTMASSPTRSPPWSATPARECLIPRETIRSNSYCGFYATSWGGCPSGYAPACSAAVDTADPFVSKRTVTDGGQATLTYEWWLKSHSQVICCPGTMPWSCTSATGIDPTAWPREPTNCIFTTAAGIFTSNPAQTLYAYGITYSVEVRESVASTRRLANYETSYFGDGKPTSEVCDETSCSGAFTVPTSTSTYPSYPYPTATRGDAAATDGPFVLQPPEKMGQLGPLAIVAITGLIGAVLLTVALLSPFMGEYFRRKEGQKQLRRVDTQ